MKIKENTTIVDTAFNLYGSLTGIPAILRQLPVGERIGFDTLPEMGEDVADIGQTWTPDLAGKDVDIKVDKIYNTLGVAKAPYSTDLYRIGAAVRYGEELIETFLPPDTTEYENMRPMNLNGWTKYASCGGVASIVNGYLRVPSSNEANSYCGSGFFKNVINARAGKPFKYSFDIRAARPTLISGGEFFLVTAKGNYSYCPLSIGIKVQSGDVFEVSIANITVLAGRPTSYTAVICDGETTEISNRVNLTRNNRTATLTIKAGLEKITNPKLFVYAGVRGSTSGNKIEFTDVRLYDPAAPVPSRAIAGLVDTLPASDVYHNTVETSPVFKHYEFEYPNMVKIASDFWVSKVYADSIDGFFEVRNIKVTQYI